MSKPNNLDNYINKNKKLQHLGFVNASRLPRKHPPASTSNHPENQQENSEFNHSHDPPEPIILKDYVFPFPHQNDEQKNMIAAMRHAISNRTNCIVESATGTGKTICLLTACLSAIKSGSQELKEIYYLTRTHSQMDCIVKQLKLTRKTYEFDFSLIQSRRGLCVNEKIMKIAEGVDFEQFNQICRKAVLKEQLENTSKQSKEEKIEEWIPSCPYKASFFFEPDKNDYLFRSYNLKKQSKIKELVQQMRGMTRQNVATIKQSSKVRGYCPYAFQKAISHKTQVKILSYKYLTDPIIFFQTRYNQKMRNSIVIFDEAHNVLDVARQEQSFQITFQQNFEAVQDDIKIISSFIETCINNGALNIQEMDQINEIKLKIEEQIGQFKKIKTEMEARLKKSRAKVLVLPLEEVYPFLSKLNIFEFSSFIRYKETHMKTIYDGITQERLGPIGKNNPEQKNKRKGIPKMALKSFVNKSKKLSYEMRQAQLNRQAVPQKPDQFAVVLDRKDKGQLKMGLECLTSRRMFDRLAKAGLKTMIFASGTLNTEQFKDEGVKFHNYLKVDNKTVNQNVQLVILDRSLIFKQKFYISKAKPQFKQVADNIRALIPVIPYGVLVFFKSYGYLKQFWNYTRQNQIQIGGAKPVYRECREKKQFQEQMEGYQRDSQTVRGAVLLGVCRGKISEGYDFKDNLCRAVFIVGLPLQEYLGVKYRLKQIVFKNEQKQQKWYYRDAMEAINQSIGRLIRHKDDFGQIYLLGDKILQKYGWLSLWVRRSYRIYEPSIKKIRIETEQFFNKRRETMAGFQFKRVEIVVKEQDFQYESYTEDIPDDGTDIFERDQEEPTDQPNSNLPPLQEELVRADIPSRNRMGLATQSKERSQLKVEETWFRKMATTIKQEYMFEPQGSTSVVVKCQEAPYMSHQEPTLIQEKSNSITWLEHNHLKTKDTRPQQPQQLRQQQDNINQQELQIQKAAPQQQVECQSDSSDSDMEYRIQFMKMQEQKKKAANKKEQQEIQEEFDVLKIMRLHNQIQSKKIREETERLERLEARKQIKQDSSKDNKFQHSSNFRLA